MFKKGKEHVLDVLNQLHLKSVDSAAVKAVRLAHVIDQLRHLYEGSLAEARSQDPELDNGASHGRVIALDPGKLFFLGHLLDLLGLVDETIFVNDVAVNFDILLLLVFGQIWLYLWKHSLELLKNLITVHKERAGSENLVDLSLHPRLVVTHEHFAVGFGNHAVSLEFYLVVLLLNSHAVGIKPLVGVEFNLSRRVFV